MMVAAHIAWSRAFIAFRVLLLRSALVTRLLGWFAWLRFWTLEVFASFLLCVACHWSFADFWCEKWYWWLGRGYAQPGCATLPYRFGWVLVWRPGSALALYFTQSKFWARNRQSVSRVAIGQRWGWKLGSGVENQPPLATSNQTVPLSGSSHTPWPQSSSPVSSSASTSNMRRSTRHLSTASMTLSNYYSQTGPKGGISCLHF